MATALPLTRGRRIALAAGVPLTAIIIGWGALTAAAWVGQGSYPVRFSLPARTGTATIRVDSGQVTVQPGAPGRLGVTGTAHYALVRSQVSWQSSASGVSVTSQCRQLTGPCEFAYTVAVPAGLAADVLNGSGDMYLWSLSGPVTAHSGTGDITAGRLSSPAVTAEDGSGNITLTGLSSQRVTASDGSGDVTVTFTRVPGYVQISAGSGDVRVVLPRGPAPYRVSTGTGSGSTAVTVPQDPASPHIITVTGDSGNITISH